MAAMTSCDVAAEYDVTHLRQSACKEFGADFGSVDMQFAKAYDGFGLLPCTGFEEHFHQHQCRSLRLQQQQQQQQLISDQSPFYPGDADDYFGWTASDEFVSAYDISKSYRYPNVDGVENPVFDSWSCKPDSPQYPAYSSTSTSSTTSSPPPDQRHWGDTCRPNDNLYGLVVVTPDGHNGRHTASNGCHGASGRRRSAMAKRMEVYPWMIESRHSADKLHRQLQQKQLLTVLPGKSLDLFDLNLEINI